MPPVRYRGPPVTVANMRENGLRSLWVACPLCHHEAVTPRRLDSFFQLGGFRRTDSAAASMQSFLVR
jgi:hypothetical protein